MCTKEELEWLQQGLIAEMRNDLTDYTRMGQQPGGLRLASL